MSPWKVILATVVIFAAGVFTGGFVAQRAFRHTKVVSVPQEFMPSPWFVRREFLGHLDRRLDLTPAQHERIGKVLEDGQEKAKIITGLMWPEMEDVLRDVTEKIRGELNPDQRAKFQELLRNPPRRPGSGPPSRDDPRRKPDSRGPQRTNAPLAPPLPESQPAPPDRAILTNAPPPAEALRQ